MEHSLGSIAGLLRENTGYLYHHPEYAQALSSIERQRLLAEFGDPNDAVTWRKACVAAYAYYHAVNDSDQDMTMVYIFSHPEYPPTRPA